jgi:polar amino acid transport system ATP-binding protein
MTALDVRGLRAARGGVEVLCGIDLAVERGEIVAVLGASGSGKTTLLRALNYLTPFSAGEVRVGGERLVPGMSEHRDRRTLQSVRRRMGFVFQGFHLFPHLTVLENVTEAPRRVLERPRPDAEAEARRLLARVGLGERVAAYPRELSGGQQQRVGVDAAGLRARICPHDRARRRVQPDLPIH